LDFPNAVAYFEPGKNYLKVDQIGTSGLSLNRSNGQLFVKAVRPGGAAEAAGILAGDRIASINGEKSHSIDMFRARELLTSAPGTSIQFELTRANQQLRAEITTKDRLLR
jgi:S1-C subfamily serine protease